MIDRKLQRSRTTRSVYFRGPTPLGMQPDKDSQRADFYRTSRNQLQAQNTSIVDGRRVCAPYHPAGSDQASQALFRGDAEQMSPAALGFLGRLRHCRIHRLLGHIKIAFAPPVPASILDLMIFGHFTYSDMRRVLTHVTEVCVECGPAFRGELCTFNTAAAAPPVASSTGDAPTTTDQDTSVHSLRSLW